jgi:hypothetical protein
MLKKLTYSIKDKIIFLKVEGSYSAIEFLDVLKRALNDSSVSNKFAIIIDARLSEADHRITDIQPIHAELRKWTKRIVCIAVVVQSDLHFGLTRQASAYDEFDGRETEPFRTIESAIDWVNKKLQGSMAQ